MAANPETCVCILQGMQDAAAQSATHPQSGLGNLTDETYLQAGLYLLTQLRLHMPMSPIF